MADYASCIFHISDTSLLVHMSNTYPQPHSLWQISFLPPDLLSCVIFILCKKPCERALLKKFDRRSSTSSGMTSAPPCQSKLLSKIHPSLASISSKYMGTESVTPSTPNAKWSDLGGVVFSGMGIDWGNPPPSRTPRPLKSPSLLISRQIRQAPCLATQNI